MRLSNLSGWVIDYTSAIPKAAPRGVGGAPVRQPMPCPQGHHSPVEGCKQLLLRLMAEGKRALDGN